MILRPFKSLFAKFRRDDDGSIALEMAIIAPALTLTWLFGFAVFDAFRDQTDGLRATYAVSDAISREKMPLTQTYLNSMNTMLGDMVRHDGSSTAMRVTIVCWSESRQKYRIAWSQVVGTTNVEAHTQNTIPNAADRLPNMIYGDQLILVESYTYHDNNWAFLKPYLSNMGDNFSTGKWVFEHFVATRPRFVSQVLWDPDHSKVCKGK